MTALLAGYGERTISPPLGTDLTGFGFYLDRRAESVLDDLKVRALYLKDQRHALLLLACDLLGFTVRLSDRLRAQIADDLKMPVDHILLSCTHTHSGPATMPLAGLGVINRAYVQGLPQAFREAAAQAAATAAEAEFGFRSEAVEPIGFNRRQWNFAEIDPWLKTAIFRRKQSTIYLLNYACHPVTLGPTKQVSADWPGALGSELEKRGGHALVLQGFCGDIDPVTCLNRRLGADQDDIALSGRILAERAVKAEKQAVFSAEVRLKAREMRIRLPLHVPPRGDLEKETEALYKATQQFPRSRRIIRAWAKRADRHYDDFRRSPWMEDVPIHALRIGGLKILGLPGEVFCRLGLKFQGAWPSLITVGYANGNVGYLPTREAYQSPLDYACYSAPRFYALFPFSPRIERILLRESQRLLETL
jgi:hypothetical protein